MSFSKSQLKDLESAYARGVTKVREGDTWVEFGTMDKLWDAIQNIRRDMESTKPSGTRLVTVSKAK